MEKQERKDENEIPETNVEPEKKRGTHRMTVEQSANLLKSLSEFKSKRDDVLNRLSQISDRMQARLNEDGSGIPTITDPAEYHVHHHEHREAPLSPIEKVAFTRIRETKSPVFDVSSIFVFMPKQLAMDDEWKRQAIEETVGTTSGVSELVGFSDEGMVLSSYGSCSAKISTGVRFSVPAGKILLIETMNPLIEIVTPHYIGKDDTGELSVIVRSVSTFPISIKCDEPLLKLVCVPIVEVKCEELLNSTFSDYINGEIK